MKKLFSSSFVILLYLQPLAARQELPEVRLAVFKNDTLSILKQGAKGDGNFLNTRAIQASIDAIHAKGDWLRICGRPSQLASTSGY